MATSARGPPGAVAVPKEGIPNRTLYVRNLPDKLPKEDLKRNLYMLFATYGVILDIVALKTMKMRGQAHVVFRDIDSSTQAMRALQGFTFFGKDMTIAYAKTKSDTIAKLDGTFKMPEPEREHDSEDAAAQPTGFGVVPAKAVPVNEQDRAKGQKRAREEEEEEEEDEDAEMEMDVSDEDSD
ncbi:U2 small nuclear ribonucleoprotein B [Dothidotthia symphoricarpi CBS 119687]|uniref:U2 small nuclear ribonucleoprotein B n=1 Tax=Dothidotthia symphoricarpi CBS 119687 TaxID=1392245 RepID=A0A6A6AQI3_9PLEO|nr:U2 small nuclear ribonucleoprotein B [Dothidotthia symphoricarpi CBS 119687]KAF2134060.1 U2 small nuclear ribonucleoprotein B [Dothidotthia symphoricarpi CBS 119687]